MMRYGQAAVLLGALAACSTSPEVESTGGGDNAAGSGGGAAGNGSGKGGASGGAGSSGKGGGSGYVFNPSTNTPTQPAGPGSGRTCGLQNYTLERLPPEILLVLDRSGSMRQPVPGSGTDRWTETTAALDDVLKQTSAGVSWGLKNFPTTSACNVSAAVEVPVAPTNYAAVGGAIKATLPNADTGGTPTGAAMRSATAFMKTLQSKNPKYIVLATDGEPTCSDMPLPAITEAVAAGFRTFVVGIATAGTGAHATLNDMAVAGMEPRADPATRYYAVSNRQDLVGALTQITQRVTNCTFPLDKAPPSRDDVAVNIGGKRVARDQNRQNGWDYGAGDRAVQLYGPACDMVKTGNISSVEIIFGCPGEVIP
jgi:hypothetical protein